MKRKALSLLLALVLCLGLTIPASAYELKGGKYSFEASNDPIATVEVDRYGETHEVYIFPDYTIITSKDSDRVGWELVMYDIDDEGNRVLYTDGMWGDDVLELDPNRSPFGGNISYIYIINYGEEDDYGEIYVASQTEAVDMGIMDGSTSTPSTPAETTPSTPDTPVTTTPVFTDVAAGSAFAPAISWAVENGVTTGRTSTTFAPNEQCTNGQILTFLWRANGSPEPTISDPYQDTIPNSFQKAAIWASEKGLVTGSTFGSATPCTRSMVVTYLWQLAGSPATSGSAGFPDVASDAAYAQAVAWAVENGITTGKTGGTFAPDDVCTRGQIVTFIYRDLAQ